jgi:hypothetical protein
VLNGLGARLILFGVKLVTDCLELVSENGWLMVLKFDAGNVVPLFGMRFWLFESLEGAHPFSRIVRDSLDALLGVSLV